MSIRPPDPVVPEFANALILTGATASGKSALALELADHLEAEIVALDSMTLYRGMDIGTAKPSAAERARVRHHLIDVLEPWESASVAWWLEQAAAACRDILARRKRPLIVGGTPFYLKAMLAGLFPAPPADLALRGRLESEAARDGPAALHARLCAVDPPSAARLHPNDVRRVVRALEVWELTGQPLSAWQTQWKPAGAAPAGPLCLPGTTIPRCIVLDMPREVIYDRINRRVLAMVEAGWVDEVRRLRALPCPWSKEAAQAVGYRELAEHLEGRVDLAGAVEQIQTRTRQFARRQLTWFRSLPECFPADRKLTLAIWHPRIEE